MTDTAHDSGSDTSFHVPREVLQQHARMLRPRAQRPLLSWMLPGTDMKVAAFNRICTALAAKLQTTVHSSPNWNVHVDSRQITQQPC